MKLHDIKLNPDNPRVIKDEKFKKLVSSIKDFPKMMELRPIVVDKNMMILGGNMRYRALQELKYTEVPDEWVKVADELTDEEKRRFIVEDNMPFGEWDFDALANQFEVEELLAWGFDESDLKIEQEVEEDEVPEVSSEPAVSKLGEVYRLGRHRLMCGDATKIEDVEKLMDGKKADMVFTDPPYGIEYDRHIGDKQEFQKKILNDNISNGWLVNIPKDIPTYICTRWDIYPIIFRELLDLGHIKNLIVWDKRSHGMGDTTTTYAPSHEFVVYLAPTDEPLLARDRDVMAITRENGLHPMMKPVELIAKLIRNHKKNMILDLFGGSGSTLIAAEQTNRTCYMMELSCAYIDVIIKRWENLTGEKAKLIEPA